MNRFEEPGTHVKQRSYINDFTNLYNMPLAEGPPKMLGFQKQMNQHKTPTPSSASAAEILKQRIHDQLRKHGPNNVEDLVQDRIRANRASANGGTINIQKLLDGRTDLQRFQVAHDTQELQDQTPYEADGHNDMSNLDCVPMEDYSTPDLEYSNTNIAAGPGSPPVAFKSGSAMDDIEHDSSIHHIPK